MTTPRFTTIPTSSILINREERQRRQIDDIEELAASISRTGLINPITIDRDNNLIAGERRLTAVLSLGWPEITVQYLEDLSPEDRQLVELEENVRRKAMHWKEECAAYARIHSIYKSRDPSWTRRQTAEAIGISTSEVYAKLDVQTAIESGNTLVADAPKYSTARAAMERDRERKRAAAVDSVVGSGTSQPITSAALPSIDVPLSERAAPPPLLNADFEAWAPAYSGTPFNFLHCDFPYGIDADKMDGSATSHIGSYNDSFETYTSLLDTLEASMDRLVSPSAHMMFWFSMRHYVYTRDRLERMGWAVLHTPLVWLKSDNSGVLPDPRRGPRWIYETAFHCTRGDRPVVRAVSNAHAFPNLKSLHASEKNPHMLLKFFSMYIDESTRMLDPTCGSGAAVRAAFEKRPESVLGLEVNPTYHAEAVERWNKWGSVT